MQKFKTLATPRLAVFIGGFVLTLGVAWPFEATAQNKTPKSPDAQAQHKNTQALANPNLATQLVELKARVARLEAALAKNTPAKSAGMKGMGGKKPAMAMKDDAMPDDAMADDAMADDAMPDDAMPDDAMPDDAMPDDAMPDDAMADDAMPDDAMPDDAMPDDAMGGMAGKKPAMGGMASMKPAMGMMDGGMMNGMEDMDMMEMMGMMGMAPKNGGGMGGTKSMAAMQKKAALPSFPGASHIYHVGATDFFLDHPEHIKLTPKQKGDLGRIKEKAVLAKTSAQRKIDEAEQELWTLTSSDEPDAAQIEGKIQEIAKLRGDQRIALIRAVGDAAKLLTDEQRQEVLGTAADETANPDLDTNAKPDPHAGHKR